MVRFANRCRDRAAIVLLCCRQEVPLAPDVDIEETARFGTEGSRAADIESLPRGDALRDWEFTKGSGSAVVVYRGDLRAVMISSW